jgi:hypothetical protein
MASEKVRVLGKPSVTVPEELIPANRNEKRKKCGNPKLGELGKPYRFKKGEPSANPAGRPKKKPLTEAYERRIAEDAGRVVPQTAPAA